MGCPVGADDHVTCGAAVGSHDGVSLVDVCTITQTKKDATYICILFRVTLQLVRFGQVGNHLVNPCEPQFLHMVATIAGIPLRPQPVVKRAAVIDGP